MKKSQIILQCNKCKKFFRVSQNRWEELLIKWKTAKNVLDNFICRSCEIPTPTVNKINRVFYEKPSMEEEMLLSHTIDGKKFNLTAVRNVLKKMILYKRLYSYQNPSIKVISKEDLEKFDILYENEIENLEQNNSNKIETETEKEEE